MSVRSWRRGSCDHLHILVCFEEFDQRLGLVAEILVCHVERRLAAHVDGVFVGTRLGESLFVGAPDARMSTTHLHGISQRRATRTITTSGWLVFMAMCSGVQPVKSGTSNAVPGRSTSSVTLRTHTNNQPNQPTRVSAESAARTTRSALVHKHVPCQLLALDGFVEPLSGDPAQDRDDLRVVAFDRGLERRLSDIGAWHIDVERLALEQRTNHILSIAQRSCTIMR